MPEGLAALPFAVLLALGGAVVIGLAWANRHRMRAVLWPNRGRVIGALVLGFATPVAVLALMFRSAYSAIVLAVGTHKFSL